MTKRLKDGGRRKLTREENTANLKKVNVKTRWKKGGPSPNPKGRPPGWSSVTKSLRDNHAKSIEEFATRELIDSGVVPPSVLRAFKGLSVAQVIAFRADVDAINGDGRAREFVTDRTDGPLKTTVGLEGEGGAIFSIEGLRSLLRKARERRAAREKDGEEEDEEKR